MFSLQIDFNHCCYFIRDTRFSTFPQFFNQFLCIFLDICLSCRHIFLAIFNYLLNLKFICTSVPLHFYNTFLLSSFLHRCQSLFVAMTKYLGKQLKVGGVYFGLWFQSVVTWLCCFWALHGEAEKKGLGTRHPLGTL